VISIDDQIRALSRRCERILSEEDLARKLENSRKSGKTLRIKLGMDPTAPDVTLGHAVPLKVIRQFQEWGHKAVLIIGDYTARVGDPSGRNKTRPMLSGQDIDANAKTYVEQVGRILLSDPDHLEVRYNGQWLGAMNLIEIIKLASRKTVAQMLDRDTFKERYTRGEDIRIHEFLYPLLQGWDSVVIEADVEMGGSDQLFNNLVGREFQKDEGHEGQVVMVTPLLIGTDGVAKMSKSKGNYIGVTDPPGGSEGMFGKVMSLPDHLLENYYTLLTDLPSEQFLPLIQSKPRDAKMALAKNLVGWLHGAAAAQAAEADFLRVIVNKEIPQDMPEMEAQRGPQKIVGLLVKAALASSNSQAIRKLREGAVRIDGVKVVDWQKDLTLEGPIVLQLGRRFVRVKVSL